MRAFSIFLVIVILFFFTKAFKTLEGTWEKLEKQKDMDKKVHTYCVETSVTMPDYLQCIRATHEEEEYK